MDIELRMLRHATALVSEGSFAKAARALHLSQPALSRSIQEVERRAGARLFERSREGVTPTETGRVFLRHASEVMAAAGDMSHEMDLVRGLVKGELLIGAGVFPTELFLSQALARLIRPGSHARIRLLHDQAPVVLARLRRREIDLGVADASWLEADAEIAVTPLTAHPGRLFVRRGHPLLDKQTPTLEDVMAYPLVTTSTIPSRLAKLDHAAGGTDARLNKLLARWMPTVAVESVTMMKQVVMQSDGITILSLYLARHELPQGRLAVLPVPLPWLKGVFSILRLAHRSLSPLGEAFVKATIEADAEVQAEEQRLAQLWLGPVRKRAR